MADSGSCNEVKLSTNNKNLLKNTNEEMSKAKLAEDIDLNEIDCRTYDSVVLQQIETNSKTASKNYDSKQQFATGEKSKTKEVAEIPSTDEDTICGIAGFKPQWIQRFATARVYLILYSIIGVLQGSYYTYLIGTISTLEKRYAFKSKTSGVIMIVDEITPLVLGVFVGYFGGKTHRPRVVALGMLISACCCFVSALPYFIYGPAQDISSLAVKNKTGSELCVSEVRRDTCNEDDRPPTVAVVLLLMFGSFLKGFGSLVYYAVGLPYMDDNAEKKNTPIYFAVTLALRLFGPLVGFLTSSAFLKYYENPFDDPGFGPNDPRWIGAWWMGFVLQGILLVIFTIPVSLFPRRLPSHPKPKFEEEFNKESLKTKFLGLYTALKRIIKNPVFIFLVLNFTMTIFGNFGHYIMLPRYMENQFRLSASNASLFSGPPGLAAVIISTLLGGVIIWKFRPTTKTLLACMVFMEIIAAAGFLLLMIPHCQKVEMSNLGFDKHGLMLENDCNSNCMCTKTSFSPVCGPDGKTTYFSPCYAGCSIKQKPVSTPGIREVFRNCSCVHDSAQNRSKDAVEGFCGDDSCWNQALIYIILLPMLQSITSVLKVAHTMILMRSIHPEDKSIALGTFETLICLLGFIPFPIIFGALVDSSCLVFEQSCGETGNCWFYDINQFNKLLHGASSFCTALSAICMAAVYFMSARVRSLYQDEEDEICIEMNTKTDETVK